MGSLSNDEIDACRLYDGVLLQLDGLVPMAELGLVLLPLFVSKGIDDLRPLCNSFNCSRICSLTSSVTVGLFLSTSSRLVAGTSIAFSVDCGLDGFNSKQN